MRFQVIIEVQYLCCVATNNSIWAKFVNEVWRCRSSDTHLKGSVIVEFVACELFICYLLTIVNVAVLISAKGNSTRKHVRHSVI